MLPSYQTDVSRRVTKFSEISRQVTMQVIRIFKTSYQVIELSKQVNYSYQRFQNKLPSYQLIK